MVFGVGPDITNDPVVITKLVWTLPYLLAYLLIGILFHYKIAIETLEVQIHVTSCFVASINNKKAKHHNSNNKV